jgi:hypothetical protein
MEEIGFREGFLFFLFRCGVGPCYATIIFVISVQINRHGDVPHQPVHRCAASTDLVQDKSTLWWLLFKLRSSLVD